MSTTTPPVHVRIETEERGGQRRGEECADTKITASIREYELIDSDAEDLRETLEGRITD